MNAYEKKDKKIYIQNWKWNKKEIKQAYPKNERDVLLSIDKNIYNLLRTTRLNLHYLASLNAYYNMEEIDMFMIDRIMSIVRETMKEMPSKNSLESLRTKKINKDFAPLFNLEKKYREEFYPIYKNKLEKARMFKLFNRLRINGSGIKI